MNEATSSKIDWMGRIGALRELIDREGPVGEAQGTLTAPLVERLIEQELFTMQVPAELGGGGAGLLDMLETAEELVYHNASVGWNVLAINVATGNAGALIADEDAARRIFSSDPLPRIAGYGAPVGIATPVEGGYRLSGRFQFGSGIAQSTWVEVAAPDPNVEPAPGPPAVLGFLVPMEDVTRLGNWDVYGLEATASEDFEIVDALIPAEHTYPLDGRAVPQRGQSYRHLGIRPVSLLGNAAVALGIARRALDEISRLAVRKARPGRPRVVDQQLFQHDFAYHDAAVRAARALARDTAVAGDVAAAQEAVTPELGHRFSQACVYAHSVGSDAVRFAYGWGGTGALRRPGRLGHTLLDMAGATQHQANDPNLLADAGAAIVETQAV
ncbi:MAG: acyl-CoA dehydrogenase family protein [Actinobacteria bacterium]|nr:acyl-CoA dehydrogenase family protein [Actinomycetota bacterium]